MQQTIFRLIQKVHWLAAKSVEFGSPRDFDEIVFFTPPLVRENELSFERQNPEMVKIHP